MENNQKVIEFQEKNLERVNYWLQFAETKNGALIAFVVAILAVIYSLDIEFKGIMGVVAIAITVIYIVALVMSVASFHTNGPIDPQHSEGGYSYKDNLLYWRDIAKYNVNDYLNRVYADFFNRNNVTNFSKAELMYAEEIIINARIARNKYKLFDKAVKTVIIATVLIPVYIVIIA